MRIIQVELPNDVGDDDMQILLDMFATAAKYVTRKNKGQAVIRVGTLHTSL